jgi:hypothetical protein
LSVQVSAPLLEVTKLSFELNRSLTGGDGSSEFAKISGLRRQVIGELKCC